MLLAVEGGGFFSSSASGYSHGLALLLLGRKNEETKPIKVSPFNQYHLVKRESKNQQQEEEREREQEDETTTNRQLASSCKCTVLGCFSCTSFSSEPVPAKKGYSYRSENVDEKRGCLKSNLKRDSSERFLVSTGDAELDATRESVEEQGQIGNFNLGGLERRKVQWTDTCGKELVEIREFEASERGASDDEYENETFRKCECAIM